MPEAPFDVIGAFLDFYECHERLARSVIGRLKDAGFTYDLRKRTGKPPNLDALMAANFTKNRKKILALCRDHHIEKGGWIEIAHRDRTFMRVYYHPDGTVRYHFGAGDRSAADTLAENKAFFLSIRQSVEGLLDEAFLEDAVRLIAHFFQGVPENGYKLMGFVGGERVTRGAWMGDRLEIEVEKLHHFMDFALVALEGLDFAAVSMKSALDMMRFYGEMKDALVRMSGTLASEGHRLEVTAGGKPIFRTGFGVTPSPTDAYGATEIRIDHTLQALAAARRNG